MMGFMRLFFLFVSLFGYFQYFSRKIKPAFAIGFVLSSISVLLFFAGVLNCLVEASVVLFVGGLLLLRKVTFSREELLDRCGVIWCWFAICLLMCVSFYGAELTRFDDFSHWGIVVKTILKNERFPNFADQNIMFQSYPPGTAAFIFYLANLSGLSKEWVWLLAQGMLLSGMSFSFYAFAEDRFQKGIVTVTILLLVCGNVPLQSLLVDTLLPMAGLSGVLFCYYYKGELEQKIVYLSSWVLFLVTIKNSGLFFAVAMIVSLLLFGAGKSRLKVSAILFAQVLLTLFFWQKHVRLVFPNGLTAKHSMSLLNYIMIFGGKNGTEQREICDAFLRKWFSISNPAIYGLLFAALLFVISGLRKETKNLKLLILFSIGAYVYYQAGNLGMYLVSMPTSEAITLDGYDRYHKSIMLFFIGILFLTCLLYDKRKDKKGRPLPGYTLEVIGLFIAFLTIMPDFQFLLKQDLPEDSMRSRMDRIVKEYNLEEELSYLVITDNVSEIDRLYLEFMVKFLLDPRQCDVLTLNDMERNPKEGGYDYVIKMGDSDGLGILWEKLYQTGDKVARMRNGAN